MVTSNKFMPATLALFACVGALAVLGLLVAVSSAPPGEAGDVLLRHGSFLAAAAAAFAVGLNLNPQHVRNYSVHASVALLLLFEVGLKFSHR